MTSLLKKFRAFTLIEVLIALLIIAIALAAAIRATNESIRATAHVKNTVVAHWVGLNVLSEIQTGLLTPPGSGNSQTGNTKMLGREWQWDAVSSESQFPNINKIIITVRFRNHVVNIVTGYIS